MQISDVTPDAYRALHDQWVDSLEKNAKTTRSFEREQRRIDGSIEGKHYRYIPCPLCGHEHYSVLHRNTPFSHSTYKNFLFQHAVNLLGRSNASRLLALLRRKNADFIKRGYPVVFCPRCHFNYRNPTYTAEGLARAYSGGGYFSMLSGDYSAKRRMLYELIYEGLEIDARTADWPQRRLLDLGCGFGLFMDFMRQRGWDPHGLDFSKESIEFGREHFDLPQMQVGNLEPDTFPAASFDAVSLISVAAHLDDPMEMFRRIQRVLRPGGILLIWTVNAGGFRHQLVRERWEGFTPNHLVFFDQKSIRRALQAVGFDQVSLGNDDRNLRQMCADGSIREEHQSEVEDLFHREKLGEMLMVCAVRGKD